MYHTFIFIQGKTLDISKSILIPFTKQQTGIWNMILHQQVQVWIKRKHWSLCVTILKEPKKSKVESIDFLGPKAYSKLKCSDKLVPITDGILFYDWTKRLYCKSIRISSKKWLVTYYLENDNHEESEILFPLPRFKKAI